jgi:hypothetical protein
MAEALPTRERKSLPAIWTLRLVIAGLLSYGSWIVLNPHGPLQRPATVIPVTHSTPVGGKLQDGVFRSSPDDDQEDLGLIRWQI